MSELVREPGQRWLDAGGDPIHNARRELLDGIKEDLAFFPHCNNIPDAKLMGFFPGLLYGVRTTLYNLEVLGYTITAPNGVVITETGEDPKFPVMDLWDSYVSDINS